ncbi:hypothetical protein [Paraburkholderia sp. J8-2]|uniref:hypothetical protein n=1 Tax=Paraburkholderia sp. J8-2 TaxID=2805440 RepID=UPI002AB62EC4|nr:hypothetical protein [Paraburkholderia sp. J8-2]
MYANPKLAQVSGRIRINVAKANMSRAMVKLVRAATVKEIAQKLSDPLKAETTKQADQSISRVFDEYCGTTGQHHGPWPGPSPHALELAAMVTILANTYIQGGELRTQLVNIAAALTSRAYNSEV